MRISIIDDDVTQQELIHWVLTAAGHSCHCFSNVREAQHNMRRESFDLVVLDWMLPDGDGLSLLKWLRSEMNLNLPVLFITSKADEDSIVQALNAGADDYMIKPLRRAELSARVGALLRRAYPDQTAPEIIEIAGVVFEPKTTTVLANGERHTLTQKEFNLGLLLFKNLGKPLSRSHIQESVWGREDDVPSRTMDTHVSRVRSKLGLRPENGFRLSPVYSYGYRLDRLQHETSASQEALLAHLAQERFGG